MGYVETAIMGLIRECRKPIRHISPLISPDSQDQTGSFEYTIGYVGTGTMARFTALSV